jgi:NAD(P)-dependent dehydrogenase (short-subunit alcohol dehydrogenase family)
MRLEGKVVLISGSSGGMGAAEARLFAKEGAKVVLGDIRDGEGEAVAHRIVEDGGQATYVHLDVTSSDDWEKAVQTAVSAYGGLTALVNNAGISIMSPLLETDEETWDRVIAVNAKGTFLGTRTSIPAMAAGGGGSIINISSLAALVGVVQGGSAYPASKGAVRSLTRATALQHAKDNIRCNVIFPGLIAETGTSVEAVSTPRFKEAIIAETPLGRFGRPDDIAYCALYLASDESSFATGAEFVIDGGRTAH